MSGLLKTLKVSGTKFFDITCILCYFLDFLYILIRNGSPDRWQQPELRILSLSVRKKCANANAGRCR